MRLLGKKSLDLKKAIQMCTITEIASQLIKTIVGAGDKKTEDIKRNSVARNFTIKVVVSRDMEEYCRI